MRPYPDRRPMVLSCRGLCTSSSSGAAGSGRAWPWLSRPPGTPWPSSTGRPQAFRRLPDDFAGRTIVGVGFDRDRLDRGRHRGGRRARRGHQRRQLQHPRRPDRQGDLRHRDASWPASTTPGGPPSTSGSASRPSPPCSGRPSGCCAASCPTAGGRVDRPAAPRSCSSSGWCRRRGRARSSASSKADGWPGSSALSRLGVVAAGRPDARAPGRRHRVRRRRGRPARRLRGRVAAGRAR